MKNLKGSLQNEINPGDIFAKIEHITIHKHDPGINELDFGNMGPFSSLTNEQISTLCEKLEILELMNDGIMRPISTKIASSIHPDSKLILYQK